MKSLNIIFLIILILLLASCSIKNDGYSEDNYNSNTPYSSNSYSKPSSIPPSYEKKAITKEEANSLRGTGYHNTRPNSVAEDMELKAAQVKCKECGHHSDNGANSLCDSCLSKNK